MRFIFTFLLFITVVSCAPSKSAAPVTSKAADNVKDSDSDNGVKPVEDFSYAPYLGYEDITDPLKIGEMCTKTLEDGARLRAEILGVEKPSVDTTLQKINTLDMLIDGIVGRSSLMANVHPDKDVRDAYDKCESRVMDFVTAISLDRDIYDAIKEVPRDNLDEKTLRSLDDLIRDYRRSGVDKEPAVRERIAEIRHQMVDASQEFEKGIREDTRYIEVDPKMLKGLPEDFIAAHEKNVDGKIKISTDYPDFFPVETYAENAKVREDLYKAFLSRGWPDNDVRLKNLLKLRNEFAHIMGFKNWADFSAEPEMAKNSDNIQSFIGRIAEIAKPRMEEDLALVLKWKKKDIKNAKRVEVWDRFYYVNKIKDKLYGVNEEDLRKYFNYNDVMKGILSLNELFFGVKFKLVEDAPVWDKSVLAYDVYDGKNVLGRFYLDMHPRDGKFKHAAMFHLISGVKDKQLPMGALVCNMPAPDKDGKAIMEHNDVVTVLHEFEHLMHHIIGGSQRWVNITGITCESEFVEAPSQLLEEWGYDAEVLGTFAKNVEDGTVIPKELVEKMKKAKEFGKGMHVMRQLFYGEISLKFHMLSKDELDTVNLLDVTKEIQEQYSPYPYVKDTYVYASFGHLNGYGSEYYSYMWSLKLAKDLFTRFTKEGMLNPKTWADYKAKIISQGGSVDAEKMVEDFLGRKTDFNAFKEYLTN
ncbi:MAG: Zn-dependent oligopeptidase [Deltaproteobacteria bacterium]|nr:Zn-dependent oligopeptidase [Deltaproteobacteria bacterium]